MLPDARTAAVMVLQWAEECGATVVAIDDADGLEVVPDPPAHLDALLCRADVRCRIGAWMDDAADRWPDAWRMARPMVRTWLAARSAARIAFTPEQYAAHDTHRAHRMRDGHARELADLLAIGDVMRCTDADTAVHALAA